MPGKTILDHEIIHKVNQWIIRSVSHPGDNEDTLLLKRIYWITALFSSLFLSGFIPVFHLMGITYWTILAIGYVGFHVINLIIFYLLRRGVEWFALSIQLFHLFFSFVNVLVSGGIFHSGGAVFIGLLGPFYALICPNRKRAVAILILYLLTVIAEVLLQPYLIPYPPITPLINISFFLLHFFTVITVFFFLLSYYVYQQVIMKQNETSHLRELDRVKTKLYTNITHEFRTPLTVILGMVEQIADNPKKWLKQGLQMIKRNGSGLLRLVNNLLDLTKLEAKAMPLHFFQGEIIGYLKYIIESFTSLAQSKKIKLHFQTGIKRLMMDFDPEIMMQIISNLLSNAIKFTPEGGNIVVQIDEQLNPGKNENELVVTVKDTGIGIPAGEVSRIFDRFYKVQSDRAPKSGGTGIGLALTRELVATLKGNIQVKSELQVGTEFTITLPVTTRSAIKQDMDFTRLKPEILPFISDTGSRSLKKKKKSKVKKDMPVLLVVEDNQDVICYLESILTVNYQVEIVLNGEEGLKRAQEIIPDMVISDVMMPEMDGFELCAKLKTDERTSHIPVILLTARASEGSKLEGLETGADDYLVKPFNVKELKVRVKNLIEQRRKLRERFNRDLTLSPRDIAVTSADERFLQKAVEIIENRIKDPAFSVERFSKEIGMSTSQLYRKILALTNQSPVEFIRIYRLKLAASLLKQKYGNVAEITYEVGFNNLSYFSKCFRKFYGKSPSEYSRSNIS